jgi:hypothetical protein
MPAARIISVLVRVLPLAKLWPLMYPPTYIKGIASRDFVVFFFCVIRLI